MKSCGPCTVDRVWVQLRVVFYCRRFESRKWGNPSFVQNFLSPDLNTRRAAFSGQKVSAYIFYSIPCPSLGWEVVAVSRRYRTGHLRACP